MKRVLMICYAFPPSRAVGALRPLYFAKHLPSFGYHPVVVHATPNPKWGSALDRSLLEEVPPEVVRLECPALEPACFTEPVARWLSLRGRIGRRAAWAVRAATDVLYRLTVERHLSPDRGVFWARALVGRLVRLVRELDVQALFSTSPPCSDHYLAWMLKRRTGLPWIADFRDLWTQNWTYGAQSRSRAKRDRILEQRFLGEADAVVSVSPFYVDVLRAQAPQRSREAFHVITNGFEPSPARRRPFSAKSSFVISYTGQVYRNQWSDAFTGALARINAELAPAAVHLRVAGAVDPDSLRGWQSLGATFSFLGEVDECEAASVASGSDGLLLLVPRGRNTEGNIPSKVFGYLAAGRPVLCLTPVRGDAARIVEETHGGIVADIDSEDEIYQAIKRLYSAWKSGSPVQGASHEAIARYERRALTGQLAAILGDVTSPGRRNGHETALTRPTAPGRQHAFNRSE